MKLCYIQFIRLTDLCFNQLLILIIVKNTREVSIMFPTESAVSHFLFNVCHHVTEDNEL